uniref:Domain of unknown function DB domain-containing protein n=1 Tax=Caenorhabditis japonica TaxID=281687 RepID=A0A8R1DR81_CAEJA
MIIPIVFTATTTLFAICSAIPTQLKDIAPITVPPCPRGSRPLLRPDGQPRKCLPHQNSLCINALPDKPNADTVCCYHNQVDYYCCLDTTEQQCPDYHQVTVVIHNSFPQNPFALKSFFFKDGIEDDIIDATFGHGDEGFQNENGILVRRPVTNEILKQ